jgi:phospholipid-binding lipoprotein MlaA
MRRAALAAVVGSLVLGLAPTAQAQTTHTPGDPWEHFNRGAYAFENMLDRVIFHPASVLFRHLAPGPIGQGIHNIIVNLSEPNAFVNDMLQGRLKRASVPAGRFVTNTTIGLLGLFDVATHLGLEHHDNEFGVTLGVYGVRPGPYLFLPLVGPSTVRDLFGSAIDGLIDPIHWAHYANRPEVSFVRALVGGLDKRVSTEAQLNALLSDAADPYATLRSVYLQNKEAEVKGESAPIDTLPSFENDTPAAPPAPAPATAGAVVVDDAPLTAGPPVAPALVAATPLSLPPLPTAPSLTTPTTPADPTPLN